MLFIQPSWPAPKNVCAVTTTRLKGNSLHPYTSFNLALHVGDDPEHVQSNRKLLSEQLNLASEPVWLQQIHSNKVVSLTEEQLSDIPTADASVTVSANRVCTIMTADCLPILICNQRGTLVAAIHAGWRGLSKGILEATVQAIPEQRFQLLAWLGPAIGPEVYEVGQDVLESFTNHDPKTITAFKAKPNAHNKWLANMYLLARMRLEALGLTAIYGGDYCTFTDDEHFYSFRRDGITGRMATLIWLSA